MIYFGYFCKLHTIISVVSMNILNIFSVVKQYKCRGKCVQFSEIPKNINISWPSRYQKWCGVNWKMLVVLSQILIVEESNVIIFCPVGQKRVWKLREISHDFAIVRHHEMLIYLGISANYTHNVNCFHVTLEYVFQL